MAAATSGERGKGKVDGRTLGAERWGVVLSALNAHTAGSVEPSALTLRGTAASSVKIVPGLWEGSHDFCCVLTPPASRFLDVGHCDRTDYK